MSIFNFLPSFLFSLTKYINKQNNVINNNDDLNEQLKIENINLKNKINEIEIENSKILFDNQSLLIKLECKKN